MPEDMSKGYDVGPDRPRVPSDAEIYADEFEAWQLAKGRTPQQATAGVELVRKIVVALEAATQPNK